MQNTCNDDASLPLASHLLSADAMQLLHIMVTSHHSSGYLLLLPACYRIVPGAARHNGRSAGSPKRLQGLFRPRVRLRRWLTKRCRPALLLLRLLCCESSNRVGERAAGLATGSAAQHGPLVLGSPLLRAVLNDLDVVDPPLRK